MKERGPFSSLNDKEKKMNKILRSGLFFGLFTIVFLSSGLAAPKEEDRPLSPSSEREAGISVSEESPLVMEKVSLSLQEDNGDDGLDDSANDADADESTDDASPSADNDDDLDAEPNDDNDESADDLDDATEELMESDDLAKAVADEIETAVRENSADELLDLATEAKLSSESILDLTKVIAYCVEAEKKGLPEESLEYCHQLLASCKLERGLTMSKIFMVDNLSPADLPRGWQLLRSMAIEDLEAALETNPDLTLAQLALGRLYMIDDGDPVKAIAALDKAIETASNERPEIMVEALKYRALLEEDRDKGTAMIEKALSLSEGNPSLLNILAGQLLAAHQDEKALEMIDKALEADPENVDFQKTKALILVELDRNEEAETLYDKALKEEGENILSKIERSQFLSSIHKDQEAIAILDQLITENNFIPTLYCLRAVAWVQQKDLKKALRDVNKALALDSSSEEAIRLKASIYIEQEKFPEAIRLLNQLRKMDPENEAVTAQLAYTLAQNDDFQGAMKRIDSLLKKNPKSLALLRGKADIYLLYGKWSEAMATYDQILADHPGDSGTLNNYSWILATSPDDSVRNGAKALELGQKAAEKTNFRESYILSTLAAAYAETGDFDKAREWSEKSVQLAEKKRDDRLDELKQETESYRKNEPWRETPKKMGVPTDSTTTETGDGEQSETEFF